MKNDKAIKVYVVAIPTAKTKTHYEFVKTIKELNSLVEDLKKSKITFNVLTDIKKR